MVGYQGWFGTPDDGCKHAEASNTGWYHYRENDMFKPGVLRNSIDMWPDMTEYTVRNDLTGRSHRSTVLMTSHRCFCTSSG